MRRFSKEITVITVLVCSLFAPTAFASGGCTVANVAGTYGYVGFGTVRAGNPLNLPAGEYSGIGTLAFDGKGNLLITDTGRIDDFFFPPDTQYAATYTVNSSCEYTFTITAWVQAGLPGPHWKGMFIANRTQAIGMAVFPGANINYVNTTKVVIRDRD
jgi:hypothetical protein